MYEVPFIVIPKEQKKKKKKKFADGNYQKQETVKFE